MEVVDIFFTLVHALTGNALVQPKAIYLPRQAIISTCLQSPKTRLAYGATKDLVSQR